jgi:GNAT superfamily N-acetyltransferase
VNGAAWTLGAVAGLAVAGLARRGARNYTPMRWEVGDEDDLDMEASGGLMDAVSAVRHGLELSGQGSLPSDEIAAHWSRIGVSPTRRALYLHDVTVAPHLRGKGAGRRYIERIEADARREDASVIVLHAYDSLGFWTKQGYALWPDPPAENPETSALLYKVLG